MVISREYRPDIDGLRAIAVLSVILFHIGFETFSGGFIGVDVFFVISGYLITRLIYIEVSEKKFSFKIFYIRRVRRLFPALFFTLLASFLLAVFLLPPPQFERFGGALTSALFSVSNFYFWLESGYFDVGADLKPLLHTWSLSVEEQFYFVWPAVLFLLLTKARDWFVPVFIVVVGCISLYTSELWLNRDPVAAFFLAPFRVVEFAIGALMVWIVGLQPRNGKYLEALVLIGLVLVIAPVFIYDSKVRFPGLTALVPCVGTAILIYAGTAKHLGMLLRNKISASIGLISYSLYLVHWPLIVFFKLNEGAVISKLLAVAAFVLLATLMYFFVEKPFRHPELRGKKRNSAAFVSGCIACAITISVPAVNAWSTNGWGWRFWNSNHGDGIFQMAKKESKRRFLIGNQICKKKGWKQCPGIVIGLKNGLIVGDSHGADALNAFHTIYPIHNFVMSTLGGCGPFSDMVNLLNNRFPNRDKCIELNKTRYSKETYADIDYVVISLLYSWYNPNHLEDYLKFLKKIGMKKVIIFGNYHVLKKDMPNFIFEFGYDPTVIRKNIASSWLFEQELSNVAKKYGYLFVSKKEALCDNECLIFMQSSIPFTWDKHHLSYEFAQLLGTRIEKKVKKYLDK